MTSMTFIAVAMSCHVFKNKLLTLSASDHLLKHVSTWKREIIQNLSLKKNVVFIGVHNRRTDYLNHYQVVSNSVLVDQVYFNTAFEIYRYSHQPMCNFFSSSRTCQLVNIYSLLIFNRFLYRKKYNDDENQVVFLAVSDDNQWIKVISTKIFYNQELIYIPVYLLECK